MRILLPLILMLCGSAFAVTGYSLPNDFSAGDTIKASKIMANYRAGSTWSTANADSLETKFMRFSDAKDTLFDTLKAKRVRASTELISSGTLTTAGLATVDSLHSVKGISGTNVWMTGTIFTDSIYANSGINAATADFTEVNSSGHVNGTTGGFSSTMTVDSLKSTKGISATTGRFSGALSGTTLTASSTATVDSLKSSKGIVATTGEFSGALSGTTLTASGTASVDSLKSTKGISVTTLTASGTAKVDSLAATKGISGTFGRFSGALSGTTLTASSTATVDSLKSVKGLSFGAGSAKVYADINAEAIDTTNGSEDGAFVVKAIVGGVMTEHIRAEGGKTAINKVFAPTYPLEVFGAGNVIGCRASAAANSALYVARNYGSTARFSTGIFDDGGTPYGSVQTTTAHALVFGTNSTAALTIGTDQSATFAGKIVPTAIATPANPAASAMQFYFKGSKFILQYNDGGTQRWKYLDLAGTGVTWVHSTSAP